MSNDLIGRRLGQYEIIGLLGGGGMATVYRARQASMQREVAIKVIKPALAERADFIRRFEREAQIIASLSHPHILKVFDYGTEGDTAYLVMELLTGGSLADVIRRGPPDAQSVLRIFEQISAALDYAHELSIIHRDLKPQNVLLDKKGYAFLTDFGIAKIVGESTNLTATGAAMGTPAYMPPEQWQGRPLDSRADLYALGIMLYESLTGRLPFEGDTPASMMYMHLQETPASVIIHRSDLPRGVDTVIRKATDKKPADRYASASEMVAALAEALRSNAPPEGAGSLAETAPDLSQVAESDGNDMEATIKPVPTRTPRQPFPERADVRADTVIPAVPGQPKAQPVQPAPALNADQEALLSGLKELLESGKKTTQPTRADRLSRLTPLLILPVIALLVVILVVLLSPRTPPLENAPFNVAIAGFVVDPAAQVSDADAKVLSQAFYTNLKTRIDEKKAVLPLVVGVWSPDQVGQVEGNTPAEREKNAQALIDRLKTGQNARADIVVYGIITRQEDRVAALPEFYLANNWPEVAEAFGRFSLNAALTAPGPEQMRGLSSELTTRAQVLSEIVLGVLQTIFQRYDEAYKTYDQILAMLGEEAPGNELLYVLRGNTAIDNYNAIFATGTERQAARLPDLLKQAEDDYRRAVELNPAYARAQVGFGVVRYLRTSSAVAPRGAWQEITDAELAEIEAAFKAASDAPDQPESADIPTKVAFGMGEVSLLRYLRGDVDTLAEAEQYFGQVLADYGDGKNPRVQEFAAQAYGLMAYIQVVRTNYAAAREAYNNAIKLTQLDARKEVFKRALLQVGFTENRANRDIEAAAQNIEALLAVKQPPTEAAALLYQLAKMYSEAGESDKALATYERAVALDLTADPALAAQIWADLGDKYYDANRLADSIRAYEMALKLDPQRQGHLAALIEKTRQEMSPQGAD